MATRQASLSCARFAIMHDVTFATSGMNSEHSRIASGVQAWRAASEPWALAPSGRQNSAPTSSASQQTERTVRIFIFPQLWNECRVEATLAAVHSTVDGSDEANGRSRERNCAWNGGENGVYCARSRAAPQRPQAKLRPLRTRSGAMPSGQRSTEDSASSAVVLSKDM